MFPFFHWLSSPPLPFLLNFHTTTIATASCSHSLSSRTLGSMATIHDLPDVILSLIVASISDTRTRNAASLVSHKFLAAERTTRTSLTLRGNVRDLFHVPTAFRSVTHLDISLLSPWGHPILDSDDDDILLAYCLSLAFPCVTSLIVYARSPSTLQILARWGHQLSHVKLIRWHQRSSSPHLGADIAPLFEHCHHALKSVDLSDFYYWTEDIPAVLQAYADVSASLTSLNLLSRPLTDGFRSHEIRDITAACPNLTTFLVVCAFDPNYIGYVGDEAFLAIAANCPRLKVLHLVDPSSLGATRGDPDNQGFTDEDAKISRVALMDFFGGLPLLEELVLDVCKSVRDSSLALETLHLKCPNLKVLKLGLFHGICLAIESQLDGVALCSGLQSLSIKKSADLTDMGLIEIGRGCCGLTKFEVHGCDKITVKGMRTLVCLLRRTLVEISISCCKNLHAAASLQALESIQDRIERLHIDCVWNGLEEDGNQEGSYGILPCFDLFDSDELEYDRKRKKCKYNYSSSENANGLGSKSWDRLRYLSLWISVGELLTPLRMAGLVDCPVLEEIRIKVEGDCRGRQKPSQKEFGLNCLIFYPRLMKMQLDCSETIGFALTAPSGQMDLSLWERFFLHGIGDLNLYELDYWPPQDKDVNHRSLSLPAAGLLAECSTLRKLFIHGTAHEHFMRFLLGIPNLRDVQLREDYYPAPENDMSTEMRVGSCSRFEDALNSRRIAD